MNITERLAGAAPKIGILALSVLVAATVFVVPAQALEACQGHHTIYGNELGNSEQDAINNCAGNTGDPWDYCGGDAPCNENFVVDSAFEYAPDHWISYCHLDFGCNRVAE